MSIQLTCHSFHKELKKVELVRLEQISLTLSRLTVMSPLGESALCYKVEQDRIKCQIRKNDGSHSVVKINQHQLGNLFMLSF